MKWRKWGTDGAHCPWFDFLTIWRDPTLGRRFAVVNTLEGFLDVHALILGRTFGGIDVFSY